MLPWLETPSGVRIRIVQGDCLACSCNLELESKSPWGRADLSGKSEREGLK
jgi:hypothetical protein